MALARVFPCCFSAPLLLLKAVTTSRGTSLCSTAASSSSTASFHPEIERRYEVHELLGRGAHGVVYRARVIGDGTKQCALKHCSVIKARQRECCLAEYDIMEALDHPNIAKLYQALEGPCFFCFCIELCLGGCLGDVVEEAIEDSTCGYGCGEAPCRNVCRQILAAVCYMHDLGCAHRDVKFDNFCLQDKDVPLDQCHLKMIDFGFARRFRQPSEEGTGAEAPIRMTTKCGTRGYTAPEVYLNDSYDERCDIFSVGVMLFCMLAGRMPFPGARPDEIISKVKQGEPQWEPSEWTEACPGGAALARRALEKDLEHRIAAREALECAWLNGQ